MLKVQGMRHGGVMANYICTAACRHCMYASSPDRSDGYITRKADGGISKKAAENMCGLLREAGCYSVHIGGGEPFMDFEGLLALVQTLTDARISVEYIETNAYWAADNARTKKWLSELARAGGDTLCISLDPYHAEYVPIELALALAKACRDTGFGFFLWQERFLKMMTGLARGRAHSRAEMEKLISPRYICDTAKIYGIGYGGRAVGIEAEYSKKFPVEAIVDSKPCRRLISGGHFHIDMHCRYIPSGCTGVAIPLEEAVRGIPDSKYPVLEALLEGGSANLLRFARERGFIPEPDGYPSGCTLCFHIRRWLSEQPGAVQDGGARRLTYSCAAYPELDPEHYRESMKYW